MKHYTLEDLRKEHERANAITLTPEHYQRFLEKYEVVETEIFHRALRYNKGTNSLVEMPLDFAAHEWKLHCKLGPSIIVKRNLYCQTFSEETYNHIVRHLYDVEPNKLEEIKLKALEDFGVSISEDEPS